MPTDPDVTVLAEKIAIELAAYYGWNIEYAREMVARATDVTGKSAMKGAADGC